MFFFNFECIKKIGKTADTLFDQKVINNTLYLHIYIYTLIVQIMRSTNYRDVFILLTFFGEGGAKNGNLKF